jgi:myotubularin-related protein 6/7/8
MRMKDSRTIVFSKDRGALDSKAGTIFTLLAQRLMSLANPVNIDRTFAFSFLMYAPSAVPRAMCRNGWRVFDVAEEFSRQGAIVPSPIPGTSHLAAPKWKMFNQDSFEICETYGKQLIFPVDMPIGDVKAVALHRSKGRLPVLTYRHKNDACLLRCAQPLVGVSNRSCREDQAYVTQFANVRLIVDARPKANAVANTAKGGGYEDIKNYNNIPIYFCDIDNIHTMRKALASLEKMLDAGANEEEEKSASNEDNYAWLKHIRTMLMGAKKVAAEMIEKKSVLVHCSDGWDRTAQLVALAQIMLDPFFRTIRGFCILVEKDWLYFGHKFGDRCSQAKAGTEEKSPIFLQFLDAVFQIMRQFPTAFEYTSRMLEFVAFHLHSCLFGTFLVDSPKESEHIRLTSRTCSIWSAILGVSKFVNPMFSPFPGEILPIIDDREIVLWRFFYRTDRKICLRSDPLEDMLDAVRLHMVATQAQMQLFRSQLREAGDRENKLRWEHGHNMLPPMYQPFMSQQSIWQDFLLTKNQLQADDVSFDRTSLSRGRRAAVAVAACPNTERIPTEVGCNAPDDVRAADSDLMNTVRQRTKRI